jgi:hypothetical protein
MAWLSSLGSAYATLDVEQGNQNSYQVVGGAIGMHNS